MLVRYQDKETTELDLVSIGCDHTTAPLALRERLAINAEQLAGVLEELGSLVAECAILSTCNRTEVWLAAADEHHLEQVRGLLAKHSGLSRAELDGCLSVYRDEAAVRHLFRVAAGLEALVVGETQIIGQVKEAYQAAVAAESAGPILSPLFQQALRVAKRVHTETALGQAAVSVAYAAVALAKDVLGSLEGRGVLLLGAGELAELCLVHLRAAGIGEVLVANRTFAKAEALASRLGAEAIPFTQAAIDLARVDMVIGSTGAPHAVLDRQDVERMMAHRDGRRLFIFDLAVPRDIAADAGSLPGVELFHIDHLRQVVAKNVDGRRQAARAASRLVDQAVRSYIADQKSRLAVPLIVALSQQAEAISSRELERLWQRLPELTAAQQQEIAATISLISRKILDTPLRRLRTLAARPDARRTLGLAAELFDVDQDPKSQPAPGA